MSVGWLYTANVAACVRAPLSSRGSGLLVLDRCVSTGPSKWMDHTKNHHHHTGQLGPFQGTASQVIDDATVDNSRRSYQNLLRVPPNDWLTATLDGVWEDWDGKFLDGTGDSTSSADNKDLGADHWKVTFLQLQIGFLGFPVFTKRFDADTSRVWRTTYLVSC